MKPGRALCLLFLLTSSTPARAANSAHVALTPALSEWKAEIEQLGGGIVVPVRVFTDRARGAVTIPRDAGHRDVLVGYFRNQSFLGGFVDSHGMNINYQGSEGKIHFVLLNMERAGEWGDGEEAVVAHEFGHVWLHSRNFPFPLYRGGSRDCAAVVAGDAVQHVVIRDEMARRGIDHRTYWIHNLNQFLDAMEQHQDRRNPPLCTVLSQVGMWIDVRLGLTAETWDRRSRFLDAFEERYPDIAPVVDELCALLETSDVHDDRVHERVLGEVLVKIYELAASLSRSSR